MAADLRATFHEELEHIRTGVARMSAGVTELVPRATEILLEADLEGAEYLILGDDEFDKRTEIIGVKVELHGADPCWQSSAITGTD